MKIFNGPEEDVINYIAGEMFNIEAGEYLYDFGDPKSVKLISYPNFPSENCNIYIEGSMGLVILPGATIKNDLVEKIINKLKFMSADYKAKNKKSHLDKFSSINTGAEHFSSMKVKRKKNVVEFERSIIIGANNILSDGMIYVSERAKFYWLIISMKEFFDITDNITKSHISASLQLLSIMYDKNKLYNYQNGELISDHMCIKNTNPAQKYIDLSYSGEFCKALINSKIKEHEKNRDNPTYNMDFSVVRNTELISRPEFYISAYSNQYTMKICTIRGSAFEIIRYFPGWEMYKNNIRSVIPIKKTIYEVQYEDLQINNKEINVETKNDVCVSCHTPLYGWVYAVFYEKPECFTVCGVCAHSNFIRTPSGYYCSDSGGINICNNNRVRNVAKFLYPKTIMEILDTLPIDSMAKKIICAFQDPEDMKIYTNNKIRTIYVNNKYGEFYTHDCDINHFLRKFLKKNTPKGVMFKSSIIVNA